MSGAGPAERFRNNATQLVGAALIAIAFAGGFSLSMGWSLEPTYMALCGGLALAAALLLAGLGAIPIFPASTALAAWVGLHVAFFAGFGAGLLVAIAVLLLFESVSRQGTIPDRFGLWSAAALGLSMLWWPRAALKLGLVSGRPQPGTADWSSVAMVVGVILALGAVELARRRLPRLPSANLLAAAALLVGALVPQFYSSSARALRIPELQGGAAATPGQPSMLLLILDTVRADHLSLYGYERPTSPELEAFVERNPNTVVYPLAHANGTWTLPSHASLFTGLLPSSHGVQAQTAFSRGVIGSVPLRAELTLAEALREAGYDTACIFANVWLRHVQGLRRGFDWFVHPVGVQALSGIGERIRGRFLPDYFVKEGLGVAESRLGLPPQAGVINEQILRFVDVCAPGPCFVVANYMEAHAPYVASRPFLARFSDGLDPEYVEPPKPADSPEKLAQIEARYDEEILGLDAAIGSLLRELEATGFLDDAWLVITSDHGEAFGEHGETEHGSAVYGEQTRVPLIIKAPGQQALPRQTGAVDLIDVASTLAAIGGAGPFGHGRDLRSDSLGGSPVRIELFPDPRNLRDEVGSVEGHPGRAAIAGQLKLIDHAGRRELYDLGEDVHERSDLADTRQAEVERLFGELPPLTPADLPTESRPLSPDEQAELRALGYVE